MELLRKAHDVNFPSAEQHCESGCALFVASFDSLTNKTKLLKGTDVELSKCQSGAEKSAGNQRCIELDNFDPNACNNFAGSGVVIKSDNAFFLRGMRSSSSFINKDIRLSLSLETFIREIRWNK